MTSCKLFKIHTHTYTYIYMKIYFSEWIGGIYWIGLNDVANEGDWRWEHNGKAPNFTSWKPPEPWGGAGNDCVVVGYFAKWDDGYCTLNLQRICEFDAIVWFISTWCLCHHFVTHWSIVGITLSEFWIKRQICSFTQMNYKKCRLQNGGQFVQAPVC